MPERHAEAIKKMLERYQVRLQPRGQYSIALQRFVAGPDVFARNSEGATIADQYKKYDICLRPAYDDRVNGWAAVLHGLGDPDAGVRPTLFFHKNCTRLIDCLPNLQHNPAKPEDVLKVDTDEDGIGGDDSADALRYLVATRTRTITTMKLRGL